VGPVHLRLAEIGLRVAGRYGFALAGGYAVQVHGILGRPSEDVDLFTARMPTVPVDSPSMSRSGSRFLPGSRSPILVTGWYTREQLLDLAEQADAGFDRRILADCSRC
jgi:hypothetical protein